MTGAEIQRTLLELLAIRGEREWLELKVNDRDPESLGEYVSALANVATLLGRPRGYVLWGVENGTFTPVGTVFDPSSTKVGNEGLESWLCRLLTPRPDIRFHSLEHAGLRFVLLEVPASLHSPVRFRETEFIRVGTCKKKLRDFPEKERALWGILDRKPFEQGIARERMTADELLGLLDFPAVFSLLKQPIPPGAPGIVDRLVREGLAVPRDGALYDVTNLGAVLFAKDLPALGLARKGVRVVVYDGLNRIRTLREQTVARGYAAGFEGLVEFINSQLPQNEHVGQALRKEERMYPEIAIRELVANALVHQDFGLTGTGPMVEIFRDRVEITNPGIPLIETDRFIDSPPRSRNDALAAFMRRLGICEERGSGVDKVIFWVEMFQLPAPDFRVTETHTQAFLYAHRPFGKMSSQDRIRACYQHAVLQWVSNAEMTNATIRKRFAISDENYATASRVIADAVKAGLIKPSDPGNKSRKYSKYVPYWA